MSTLVMPLGSNTPSIAAPPPASPSLFARLTRRREMRARGEVLSYLMSLSDERLAGPGFDADHIRDLRQANLRIPVAR